MYAVYLLFMFVDLMFLCPKLNNCSSFFSGLCFICLSGVQCICLYICLYPFSIHICISGLCSLCPAVSPMLPNVTSVIKNLWKSARTYFLCVFYFVCPRSGVPTVLYASSVLGPNSRFGIRIRSIVFPCTFSIALTSVQSQLYPHVHRQSHWRVYTRTISILLLYPPHMKSA